MATTGSDLMRRLDKLEGLLEKAAKPRVDPVPTFGGFGVQKDNSWPYEKLDKLAATYNSSQAAWLMGKGNSRPRCIGWGPMLKKMVGIAEPKVADDKNYGLGSLEKEYGAVTVGHAKSHGIKSFNGEVRKTALAEGSGVTGGYVVPPQFQNELLTIAAEDEFIEPKSKIIPMNSRTMTIPMLDITTAQATGTSPYIGGILAQWQPEAALINETEPTFRQSEWTAWDLVMYTVSSAQLLADNGIGLDALLTQLFAQAVTWYKEYAFLRGLGAGSSMPMGIVNAPATYVQSRSGSNLFSIVDVAAMMSRLHVRSWDSAMWIMHQSLLPKLIQMYASASSSDWLTWLSPFGDGKVGPMGMKMPKAFFNGLPLYFTEKLPQLGTKGDVCLVDWSQYVIGQRLDIQVDVSTHYLFRNNQLAWRVVLRCDGKPWLNNSITDASGFVSSPFVVLNT